MDDGSRWDVPCEGCGLSDLRNKVMQEEAVRQSGTGAIQTTDALTYAMVAAGLASAVVALLIYRKRRQ